MDAYIIDALRTPIGKYAGTLSTIRPDDLAAHVVKALVARNPWLDTNQIEDVILGAANQSGEDNRNVGRMAVLLAGLPITVGGITVNRLCASGLQAIGDAARAIKSGDGEIYIAGGVESMSRAPMVMSKATSAFDINCLIRHWAGDLLIRSFRRTISSRWERQQRMWQSSGKYRAKNRINSRMSHR
jgi:acetyl-CoA acetyltransferase